MKIQYRRPDYIGVTIIVAVILVITFIPYLSLTLFNTKGEPREAIVALSMLQQDNWVLPVSCGGDIPYKPPMLAWCVAFFARLFGGGEVSEFTSRLPSALALVVMMVALFRYWAHRGSVALAGVATFVTVGCFEVYRAGMACRVDMLNTMFIVLALLSLARWCERGCRRVPVVAALLMSGAFLTKGPVGVVLPCLVTWVYALAAGRHGVWRVTWRLACGALMACILPAIWYYAAWKQGGDTFLALVIEENFGRMTGSMSYDSHVNPWYYNIITLISGMMPYTLAVLLTLFSFKPRRVHLARKGDNGFISRALAHLRTLKPETLFALVTVVVIFVFYCIPASKRSVYLLPIYPFVAWFVTRYINFMCTRGPRMVKAYACVIGCVAMLAPLVYMLIVMPESNVLHLPARIYADMRSYVPPIWCDMTLGCSFGIGLLTLVAVIHRDAATAMSRAVMTVVVIFWSYGAVYSPAVLNGRSDRPTADLVTSVAPDGPVYAYTADRLIRFYTIGFYTGDRVRRIDADVPQGHGMMLVAERDLEAFDTFNESLDTPYRLTLVNKTERKSCDLRSPVYLFEYDR